MRKKYDISGEKNPNSRWNLLTLKEEALKYNTRTEFQNKNKGAYLSAYRKGFLDMVCAHMKVIYNSWTHDNISTEALKYKTRTEFQNNCGGGYMYAINNGILDQICSHMGLSGTTSGPEKELLLIIRNFYSSAKKIRDRKVKIETKPYIKGFEIDIFVPEINKGIEFDGRHYHSFEFMRKDKFKTQWSDIDIQHYNSIKDDWFASKGIKILHVKEQDWILNKESCIKKCLDFLNGDLCL